VQWRLGKSAQIPIAEQLEEDPGPPYGNLNDGCHEQEGEGDENDDIHSTVPAKFVVATQHMAMRMLLSSLKSKIWYTLYKHLHADRAGDVWAACHWIR
jgi:hypothetical protein